MFLAELVVGIIGIEFVIYLNSLRLSSLSYVSMDPSFLVEI